MLKVKYRCIVPVLRYGCLAGRQMCLVKLVCYSFLQMSTYSQQCSTLCRCLNAIVATSLVYIQNEGIKFFRKLILDTYRLTNNRSTGGQCVHPVTATAACPPHLSNATNTVL